ncbi:cytochrome c3 family protein [Lutibacter sp.]|uniref:cytochrome c3 family protein n=1 Tax=Lutibacter sp. TaxID=1925666 RepID=UPI001A2394E4|nr:cytochrome c3 family protein [Lutibacter sp.]MBI9042693.1 hypothetical protein [Lutibacter sp.]
MKLQFLLLFILLITTYSYAQISPGDLTSAHAKFEGMNNCTLCHELGKKVTNSKCLDCHKEIKSLITAKRGYHNSSDVKRKDCFQCHSEHHGRKFEMVRFDEANFDHKLTGYKLDGKHEVIDCKKCHVADFIEDSDLKKRSKTFLGLETKCLTCHDDYHQKTLSTNDCTQCHTTQEFSPASKFDHNKADFKLKGKHETVDCKKCHELSQKNGKEFQKFNNIPFSDCKSCHNNPHNEKITGACTQCHVEESFNLFKGRGKFNHNTTNFTLKGKHQQIDCFSCHEKTSNPKLVFQDKKAIDETNCIACHTDTHEGKLGNDCVTCHSENSFVSSKTMNSFDHNLSDFSLEGKHTEVDCKKCHKVGKFTDAIAFSSCMNCHTDYHEGEFIKNNASPDCNTCHTVEAGFDTSLFTLERHEATNFALKGAHVATPCFACHVDEADNKWKFKDKGTTCVECHEDIHKDDIDPKYYPKSTCESCHINDTWATVNFDHTKTTWSLEGKHRTTECKDCHSTTKEPSDIFNRKFTNLDTQCINCHENNHGNQFAINGKTECVRCHIFDSWAPEKFDHNTTAFPLEGKHAEIECNQCHIASINTIDTKNTSFNYKIEKFQCIDCHQ